MSTKATFTLDSETVAQLEATSKRLGMNKSAVVREAIADFGARVDRLSDRERERILASFDELVPPIAERSHESVSGEIADLRAARRGGGRKSAERL